MTVRSCQKCCRHIIIDSLYLTVIIVLLLQSAQKILLIIVCFLKPEMKALSYLIAKSSRERDEYEKPFEQELPKDDGAGAELLFEI